MPKNAEVSRQMTLLQTILYEAKASPCGLLLRVSDAHRARQKLYRARVLAADPSLANLQFRLAPFGENLIAITKGAPDE